MVPVRPDAAWGSNRGGPHTGLLSWRNVVDASPAEV